MDASSGVPFSLPNQVSLRSNEDKNYSVALSSQRNGQGLERPRVGGHRDLHTPHPTPCPTCTQSRPASGGLEALRAPRPGQATPGLRLVGFGGVVSSAGQSPGRQSCRSTSARAACQEVQPAWPTGRSGRSELKGGAAQGSWGARRQLCPSRAIAA